MLRQLASGVCFGAAFLVVSAGIRELAPQRLKIAWLEAHGEDYTAVFVGSSHFFRQIDPQRFDGVLAEAGRESRSFNCGIPGMKTPEMIAVVDRLLEQDAERLELLFLELLEFDPSIEDENRLTQRTVDWHTPRVTALAARWVLRLEAALGAKLGELWMHARHLAHYLGNVGRGIEAARFLLTGEGQSFEDRPSLGPNRDGFRSLDLESGRNFDRRRNELMRDLPGYRRSVQALRSLSPADGSGDAFLADCLQALAGRLADRGATLVLVLNPGLEPRGELRALARRPDFPLLLAFNDPDRYPGLYELDRRFDRFHLNGRGAAEFTEALAREYLASAAGPASD